MRFLCAADLHIGRTSSALSDEAGVGHSSASAWERVVDLAVSERVDAVLVAGDLVDQDNALYEAVGRVEAGVRRLAENAIPLYAVAGNHDTRVFARLHALTDAAGFHFVGAGGTWQECALDGSREAALLGWSFPGTHYRGNPLQAEPGPRANAAVTIGLLHADLRGGGASPYAPVELGDLLGAQTTLWVLGHQHQYQEIRDPSGRLVAIYPGSTQALDPGETGPHGVWLLTVDAKGQVTTEFRALSSARYVTSELDVTGVADKDAWEQATKDHLRSLLEEALAADGGQALRIVSCRLRFTGATPCSRQIDSWVEAGMERLIVSHGQATLQVEWMRNESCLPRDLDTLCERRDVLGVLARLVRDLADPGTDAALLDEASRLVRPLAAPFGLTTDGIDQPDALRVRLRACAERLLDQLRQNGEARNV